MGFLGRHYHLMGQSSPLRSPLHTAQQQERERGGRSRRKKLPPTPPPLLPLQPLLLSPSSSVPSPLAFSPLSPQSAGFLGSFEVRRLEAAMEKANKVVLAQPAATAPRTLLPRAPGPVRDGESCRARLRYQSLLQDYKELLKESAAKKNILHMEKLRKQRLLAEVKFLRRRYKSMSENPSQTVVYKVKNPAMRGPASRTTVSIQAIGSSSKSLPAQQQWRHAAPRASPAPIDLDLNEACEPSSEEIEEFHGYHESVGAGPSNAKTPAAAFWDVRNPAVRAGKRKISWQDQLALRV